MEYQNNQQLDSEQEKQVIEPEINNIESNFDYETGLNLQPEVRVGMAIYMTLLNKGVVTPAGVLMQEAFNMTQVARQAEVSVNYAIKALSNIRKMGFIKNRKEDGRLLIKLQELEGWLSTNGIELDA